MVNRGKLPVIQAKIGRKSVYLWWDGMRYVYVLVR